MATRRFFHAELVFFDRRPNVLRRECFQKRHSPYVCTRAQLVRLADDFAHHYIYTSMADPPGLHVTKDSLSVLTHIAVLENGKLPLPPFTDSIIIEVGTSDRDTADKEILPAYPNASLI